MFYFLDVKVKSFNLFVDLKVIFLFNYQIVLELWNIELVGLSLGLYFMGFWQRGDRIWNRCVFIFLINYSRYVILESIFIKGKNKIFDYY